MNCDKKKWFEPYLSLDPETGADPLPQDMVVMPIEAYRGWHVPSGSVLLHSYQLSNVLWEPGHPLEAECCGNDMCLGDCDGGIYAVKTFKHLIHVVHPMLAILGKVKLWGHIVEHDDGYRAQFAYPSLIYNTKPLCKEIAYLYGIPLAPDPFELPDTLV